MKKLEFERNGIESVNVFSREVKKKIKELGRALAESSVLNEDYDWNSTTALEKTAANEENLETLLRLRLCRTIINSADFRSFHQWLENKALWVSQFDARYLMPSQSLTDSHVDLAASVVFKDVNVQMPFDIVNFFFGLLSFRKKFEGAYRQLVENCCQLSVLRPIVSNIVTAIFDAAAEALGNLQETKADEKRNVIEESRKNLRETTSVANDMAMYMFSIGAANELSDKLLPSSDEKLSDWLESSIKRKTIAVYGCCGFKVLTSSSATDLLEDILLCRYSTATLGAKYSKCNGF